MSRQSKTTYTYYPAAGSPITLHVGQNGITEKHIVQLDELEHAAALNERYEQEKQDRLINRQKQSHADAPDEFYGDPIQNLGTDDTDPAQILFQEEKPLNPQIEQLLALMQKLKPEQVDLIYELYGMRRPIVDIARESGVTEAAIRNRRTKIINRLKKLFAEADEH